MPIGFARPLRQCRVQIRKLAGKHPRASDVSRRGRGSVDFGGSEQAERSRDDRGQIAENVAEELLKTKYEADEKERLPASASLMIPLADKDWTSTYILSEDHAVELAGIACQNHGSRVDEVVAQPVDELRILITDGFGDDLAPETRCGHHVGLVDRDDWQWIWLVCERQSRCYTSQPNNLLSCVLAQIDAAMDAMSSGTVSKYLRY